MGFDPTISVIQKQQGYILGKVYGSKLLQGIYGKHLARNVALTFFFYSLFIDVGRYIFYDHFRKELFDPLTGFFNVLTLFAYAWIFHKYRYLVNNRKDPSIGMKVINTEAYINIRYVFLMGICSNISLVLLPLSFVAFPARLENGLNLFFILDVVETFVFVLITIPSFIFLYIENPRESYYVRAKNKVKSLLEHRPPVPVPVPVGR